MSISTKTKYRGFYKGWNQVPKGQLVEVRLEIQRRLKINRSAFYKRLNGEVEPKLTEAIAIGFVFNSYGITNIWDDEYASNTN